MASHSPKSLFDLNIQSAKDCLAVYDGIEKLKTRLEITWLLRSAVVFAISAMDAYFHDKVKYRAGRYGIHEIPPALAKFEIPLSSLPTWDAATRKGNVIRNWVVDELSTKPLQRKDDIAAALKLVGITEFWPTLESDTPAREELLDELQVFVRRRNQIAHEGDRESSRRSGKKLRPIDRDYAQQCVDFVEGLITRVEHSFPK